MLRSLSRGRTRTSDLRPIRGGLSGPDLARVPACILVEMLESDAVAPPGAGQVYAGLCAAVRSIAALAPVDDVLQIIADRVRPLVGAQYAALGIVDTDGRIERFITSGIDEPTRRRIGALPEGQGLLGLIIRENRTFRIADINIDPRRHGFPPHHPAMTSFLGVPITFGGVSLGRLYLTNKIGAPEFSADDQVLVPSASVESRPPTSRMSSRS
jgi:transcriptional regulator with GAF, ATPase, and Fis domain